MAYSTKLAGVNHGITFKTWRLTLSLLHSTNLMGTTPQRITKKNEQFVQESEKKGNANF